MSHEEREESATKNTKITKGCSLCVFVPFVAQNFVPSVAKR
jgi:hypothetical protein